MALLNKLTGGTNNEDSQSVQELDQKLNEKEKKVLKQKGKQRLKDLKQRKRNKLQEKEKELEQEKFNQTNAGKLFDRVGNALDGLSQEAESKDVKNSLNELAGDLELVDGDGKNDSRKASNFFGGVEKQEEDNSINGEIKVSGTLEVDSEQEKTGSKKDSSSSSSPFDVDMDVDLGL